jgi:hypothetical protein
MSRGARWVLAFFVALGGVIMCLTAPPTDKAPFFYGFGAICFAIAVACVAEGRVAKLFGSIVACVVFALGVAYLGHELWAGPLWSASRAEPSVENACLFLLVFGVPAIAYVVRARFGLGKAAPPNPLDFSFEGILAGRFEGPDPPRSAGRHRYMPYRSVGHLRMGQALANGPARCSFEDAGSRYDFVVASVPEYGVLLVESVRPR